MYCHRLVITHPQSVIEVLKECFLNNLQNHEQKVKTIFEVKGVVGMRRTTLIHTPHLCSFSLPPLRVQQPSQPRRPRPHQRPRVSMPLENENAVFDTVAIGQDNHVDENEEVQNIFPDLLGCFSNEGFDQNRFVEFAEDFFSKIPSAWRKMNSTRFKTKRLRSFPCWPRAATSSAHCRGSR